MAAWAGLGPLGMAAQIDPTSSPSSRTATTARETMSSSGRSTVMTSSETRSLSKTPVAAIASR